MKQSRLLEPEIITGYHVEQINRDECEPYIIGIHYAHRWPSISYAYGLYLNGVLVGVVSYGSPPSPPLTNGIAGEDYAPDVLELNRLCLKYNVKNEASMLVGRSLKLLPQNRIIVSFADTEQGHKGYVYQATNFKYCGLSAKRTDWKVKGKEHLHGKTISGEFKDAASSVQSMRDKYGDDFYLAPRSRKHRYIYIVGSKKYKREVLSELRYGVEPYPKY